jgi:hypothetical protein
LDDALRLMLIKSDENVHRGGSQGQKAYQEWLEMSMREALKDKKLIKRDLCKQSKEIRNELRKEIARLASQNTSLLTMKHSQWS